MPGPVLGIHVLLRSTKKDVDGRDEPGHDRQFVFKLESGAHAAGCSAASPFASRCTSARLIAACRVGAVICAPSRSVT